MSRETGLRTWLPDQVYKDEQTARDVLDYLIAQYGISSSPVHNPYVLGICLKNTAELIGHVGLSPKNSQVEIGYAVEDKYQGKGYATQAARTMADWGMQHFGLESILGIVSADNTASCRVLEKAGFSLVRQAMGRLHGREQLIRTYQRTTMNPACHGSA